MLDRLDLFQTVFSVKSLVALGSLIVMIHTYPSWVFNYPPGPKPSWPFGNEIPSNRQWLKFDEWRRRYGELSSHERTMQALTITSPGDVVRITVMGQPAVILGSFKAANDLLDSRGTRYCCLVTRRLYLSSTMKGQYILIDHLLRWPVSCKNMFCDHPNHCLSRRA